MTSWYEEIAIGHHMVSTTRLGVLDLMFKPLDHFLELDWTTLSPFVVSSYFQRVAENTSGTADVSIFSRV